MSAGVAVLTLREASGLTRREVAKLAGVGERYLARVEDGAALPNALWTKHVVGVLVDRPVAR